MVYFCLRYAAGARVVSDRLGYLAFACYNIGLIMWTLFTFFPVGWPQLEAVFTHGLTYARSLDFYNGTVYWQWFRIFGDIIFAAGALIMAYDFIIRLKPFFGAPAPARARALPAE